MKCHKLEEVLASKLTTLLHRRSPGDLFDLLYAIVFRDQFGVNRREVVTTFLKKSIFEGEPTAARDLLRALPIVTFRELWQSLVAPVASLFNFDFVLANFQDLIESLFALIIPAVQPAFVPVVPAARITRPFGSIGRSVGGAFRNYFSADIRNTIISAGRAGMMVQLSYGWLQSSRRALQAGILCAKEGWAGTGIFLGLGHIRRQEWQNRH